MKQEVIKIEDFDAIRLKLASPEEILKWSHGEVVKPETINYRTQRAEKDGLFCEKIFGPGKDWECYCGKYKRIRYKGIVCDRCGVEVTQASVRRERMGHIKLAVPVSHIWFLRGVPSKMGLFFDMSFQNLEKVIYFGAYIISRVDEKGKIKVLKEIEKEYKTKLKSIKAKKEKELFKTEKSRAVEEVKRLQKNRILSEMAYQDMSMRYGHIFEAGIGAGALRDIVKEIDLDKEVKELEEKAKKISVSQKRKVLRRLRLVKRMQISGIRPEWMFLTILPVMPPDLRPMVQLDGGRFATSDVNDLYRRVINRNNRLKKLVELNAPEVICRNEKRMLQEAVDALIDNSSRRGQGAVIAQTGQRRQLKSLADMLKGKQGRFRQNLLGKRVDYSGRSVIVVGPELKLGQCGIPKKMALELFKPFVIQKLIENEFAYNIRGAGRLIEQGTDEVWAALEEVIQDRYVLLNRAPTLHRLGVQAFKPILIEGYAIQIHPMVCLAFGADFDGDQMAVHIPLSEDAQKEAREIMLSSKNLFKPATGESIVIPTQDIVLGCYFMTRIVDEAKGKEKIFTDSEEAILAYRFDKINLKAPIKLRVDNKLIDTCVGRAIFNSILPKDFGFVNKELDQKTLRLLIEDLIDKYGPKIAAETLDRIKTLGFRYATKSGISMSLYDLKVPKEKTKLILKAEKEADEIRKQYQQGFLTKQERRTRIIEIWGKTKQEVASMVPKSLDPHGPIHAIFSSGARGSWAQTVQIVGMKGLVINPASEIIELPVKSSFKEGFNVLEYFISTHGARKGTSDTALRTATAGYLTRRLIDVAQDIIIHEEDCGDKEGITVYRKDTKDLGISLAPRIFGRVSLETIKDPKTKKILAKKGELIDKLTAKKIDEIGSDKIQMRSVISCKTRLGLCQKCYGYDLGKNKLIELGEAVGIVTAQAIGEPGTQLTMRTFHTGGVAGGADITQGLPRVEEIFEARSPKGKAILSEVDGPVVGIREEGSQNIIIIEPSKTKKEEKTAIAQTSASVQRGKQKKQKSKKQDVKEYAIPLKTGLWVKKGDLVAKGQQLCEGPIDLKELFSLADQEAVQRYIIKEVQNIYSTQGGGMNDKHIEVITRQMFARIKVEDSGDTDLLPGVVMEKDKLLEENDKVKKKGGKPATFQPLFLGITKVSLTAESFLSAASFQETVRVLINAAIEGKKDILRGLKENVILGKLIPAGTGFKKRGKKP